ncbi:hypothetical protein E5163_11555 [Marinicauda algicola]|uniref:Uncharacterized protein n=1 Tax=Marinicauda algicola TaxID=2029849 RepID=A0A4S2GZ75_9PROT|nr:hypothetical protein [Marinicauda algicola]TGY88446.1 hypothetical protein E5163_11555 [Marinicauda algicola]
MAMMDLRVIEGGADRRPASQPALTRWLETQARVVELWIERLVGEGGDPRTIAVLQQHAAFLRETGEL